MSSIYSTDHYLDDYPDPRTYYDPKENPNDPKSVATDKPLTDNESASPDID